MNDLQTQDCTHSVANEWLQHDVRQVHHGWLATQPPSLEREFIKQITTGERWTRWGHPEAGAQPVVERPLEERFLEQARKWESETGHISSPTQKMTHPSYQAILGMGRDHKHEVIGLLIRDMRKNERAWFNALSYLTQENPINRADAGDMDKMIAAWVTWGKNKGLL